MKDKSYNIKMLNTIFMAKNNLTKLDARRQIGLIWANHKKKLIYLIYKMFWQINKKNINNSMRKWAKKKEKQMAFKYIKRCSISYVIREMRYHSFPFKLTKILIDNQQCLVKHLSVNKCW